MSPSFTSEEKIILFKKDCKMRAGDFVNVNKQSLDADVNLTAETGQGIERWVH